MGMDSQADSSDVGQSEPCSEAIAEVFSRIDHKFDLMCLGYSG